MPFDIVFYITNNYWNSYVYIGLSNCRVMKMIAQEALRRDIKLLSRDQANVNALKRSSMVAIFDILIV